MKLLLSITLLCASLFAAPLKQPVGSFEGSGSVVDIVYKNGKIYSATAASSVDIFDFETKKLLQKIEVPKIIDFAGDLVHSKVYSVDVIEDKILILSQDKDGFRRIHIHKNDKTELLFDTNEALAVAKAKFLNKDTILLGLLSNELISYDINKKTYNWSLQVSGAKFSDFVLNEQKSEAVVADESGDLKIHDTKNGKRLRLLADQNLDNVFQVDYKKGVIATAGQDRRTVIYVPKVNSAYFVESGFLIYSVGLSPSGKTAAFASDELNNVTVFDTITKATLGKFGGNKMTLTKIIFIDEDRFLVGSDDKTINLYSIK
ncbi:WD40 repeat domain-containing protein [Sulfurimonas sp.]|uniref:WD40 repeat domain-containing protein n=1 Tax=Sulfurimonas sp. TaxID=2022749 RepID=UPI003D1226E1